MFKPKFSFVIYTIICLMIIIAIPLSASAEEENYKKTVGITASLQGEETSVMFPIWINERFVLTPAISVISMQDVEHEFGFAIGPRYNFKTGKAVPYLGFRGGILCMGVDGGETTDDFFFSTIFGGEYFIADQFSVGVEMQLNVTFSDKYSMRYGNPGGTNFNTASAVAATFYF